jgi:hypothetical protein
MLKTAYILQFIGFLEGIERSKQSIVIGGDQVRNIP